MVVFCTVITSLGQLFWKIGAKMLPDVFTNWPLLLGFALHIIAAVILITSFKTGEVSVLFPMYATNYVWVSLLSFYYLHEPLNLLKWVGMIVVIMGVILIGKGAHKHPGVITP
jgi:undecaprenyl phosphate-alpha-L-ara4N flippase subunit ArnE